MDKGLRAELLEKLSDLEHRQWMEWSQAVAKEVSPERATRWKAYQVPYDQLDEKTKQMDREWAEKVLEILQPYMKKKELVSEIQAYPMLQKLIG
jgi:hypothetical protein